MSDAKVKVYRQMAMMMTITKVMVVVISAILSSVIQSVQINFSVHAVCTVSEGQTLADQLSAPVV